MIFLFTDFSYQGPYVGQVKSVLGQACPNITVVDLMHDAPRCNPKAAAYLLASLLETLPESCVVAGVVDPGVGSEFRRPIILQVDERWFVGPDNGLFELVTRSASQLRCWEITIRPAGLSTTFHGRDLFAPVAAHLATGGNPADLAEEIDQPESVSWPDDLGEVIYQDGFGNLMTGLRASRLASNTWLRVGDIRIGHASTFSEVPVGDVFWYANSNGLAEIAVNQGSAADKLAIQIGCPVEIFNP